MNRILLAVLPVSLALTGGAFAATPSTPGTASAPAASSQQTASQQSYRRDKPLAARMTRALNILEADGYGSFTNFHADGKNFAATVTGQGKPLSVFVDPDSGRVRPS